MGITKVVKTGALAAALSVGTSMAANADPILDFEGFAFISGSSTAIVGDEFEADFGVTFSSGDGLNVVDVGGDQDGFVPNDTPIPPGVFGDFFLTSDFGTNTLLSIQYTVPVFGATFDVADIDGEGDQMEQFSFSVWLGMTQLASRMVVSGDPGTGDAEVLTIGFSGLGEFDRIEIEGTTSGGERLIGIAFDNFNTTTDTTVPAPATLALFGFGLAALGWRKRKTS